MRVPVTNPHTIVPRTSSKQSGAVAVRYRLMVLAGADWLFRPPEHALRYNGL